MRKKITVISLLVIVLAVCVYMVTDRVTLYNEAGKTIRVKEEKIEKYKSEGWYDAPVTIIYNTDGLSSCIYTSEVAQYEANGWYTEPVTLMYMEDNKQYVKQSEIEAYKNNGWYTEPLRVIYTLEGGKTYILESETEYYVSQGWTLEPPTREGLSDLRTEIEQYIKKRSGEWGVFVKSMETNEYLSINEKKYSSASLIKLYTMAATYAKVNDGELSMTDDLKNKLTLMICESSNTACNSLTKINGDGNTIRGFNFENENTKAIGCKNTEHGSELVDDTGRKVTFVGYNRTSPMDCGTVLEQIYRGKLVSQTASKEMLDLLLNQQRTWKIPASLPEGTVVANKTGETNTAQGDAAIVYSPACDYIICVIGNGSVGSGIETIQEVSRMTYNYVNP